LGNESVTEKWLKYQQTTSSLPPQGNCPESLYQSPNPSPKPIEEFVGKIEGIIYNHFGDFDGFILETESGRHHRFNSRELSMLKLIREAWREHIRVAVLAEPHHHSVPRSVVLRGGAPRFRDID
jgi:hypothetical protein